MTLEVLLKGLIDSNLSPQSKIHQLQETFLYSIDPSDARVKDLSRQEWEQFLARKGLLLEQLPEQVAESPFYHPEKTFTSGSRLLSLDFLSKLNLAHDLGSVLGSRFRTGASVLEIGGGYGQMARAVKLLSPESRYLILDLPESLYFAALYLSLNFPQARLYWPSDSDDLREICSRGYDFLFLPCYRAEELTAVPQHYDAAINKSSFGEMNNRTSAYYVDLLQSKLPVEILFLLNRFLNPVDPLVQTYRSDENQWFDHLDRRWETLVWEVEPEFTRFPYNEILHHRELYFIGRRSPEPLPSKPIDSIYHQKWYTNFTTVPFARHSKMLAACLGQGSILEQLVNRVRCIRDVRALDALIKLIYLLEGKFPFEERYYYAQLYRRLTGRSHALSRGIPRAARFGLRLFITATGIGLLLRYPTIPMMVVRILRGIGIDVRWTYRTLKKLLLREE